MMRQLQPRYAEARNAALTGLMRQWLINRPQTSVRIYYDQISRLSGVGSTTYRKKPPSILRKVVAIGVFGLLSASIGSICALAPFFPGIFELSEPPSDDKSLALYVPDDRSAQGIEDFINRHPLAAELRKNPNMVESRPYMKIPPSLRRHNLTAGTLLGRGGITVPPFAWVEKGGNSFVSISHVGSDLCGHPGIIHGGVLATILDEGLARCCFAALPHHVGVTAKLEINYKKPAPAGSFIVLRATTTKVEGRRAWVKGYIETLAGPGEQPIVLAEADALFVSPKISGFMAKLAGAG